MKTTQKIIYLYRSGLKIYNVGPDLVPVLEKEMKSSNIEEIKIGLKYLSDQSIFLLLSDEISYLYEKNINPPLIVDDNFKKNLLDLVKADIPEEFSEFVWDYKIKDDLNGVQKVSIFAPTKEFQILINQIANILNIKFEVIEPESIAITRDKNPILGIIQKTDINGKDIETLNLSISPKKETRKIPLKKIGVIVITTISIVSLVFLYLNSKKNTNIVTTVTPTLVPSIMVSPSPVVKDFSDLTLLVQNGTTQSGLASKTASIFRNNGIKQVDVGNADNNSYTFNKLIFKENSLKDAYQEKFISLIIINNENIIVDKSVTYDVIFIVGNN